MSDALTIVGVIVLSYALVYLMIPALIGLATRTGLLDDPADPRRIHHVAVPRLGGVAIFAVVFAVSAFSIVRAMGDPAALVRNVAFTAALAMVFATGLADDVRGLSPKAKLLGQGLAALVVARYVFSPNSIVLAAGFASLPLGWLAAPLFMVWIVGVTNAFNLIDGIDGLAGTAALIGLVTCFALDAFGLSGNSPLVVVAAIGSVFAFLRFNRFPAKLFLGDSGAMVLGFLLSVRLVMSATDTGGHTFVLVPLAALALPLLDTGIAIVRRWLRGDPFSRADGRHIHHQMLALGLSARTTVELLGACFALVAVLGMSISYAPPQASLALMLASAAIAFATFWYGLRWLRYHEFFAVSASLGSVVRNARAVIRTNIRTDESAQSLRQARNLTEVRATIAALIADSNVLDIEVLESNENLHAHGPSRQRISSYDALPLRLDYPFACEGPNGMREMILRIWCPRPARIGPRHTAERVAARIGPALEEWFRSNAGQELRDELSAPGASGHSQGSSVTSL